jgi:hypothetical protein
MRLSDSSLLRSEVPPKEWTRGGEPEKENRPCP